MRNVAFYCADSETKNFFFQTKPIKKKKTFRSMFVFRYVGHVQSAVSSRISSHQVNTGWKPKMKKSSLLMVIRKL